MADDALFLGWGQVVRGRERRAFEVFNESMQYYGQLQRDGRIESFDTWLVGPHGGDLIGFTLLRGEPQRLDEIRRDPEFERLITRAGLVVDRIGVVGAVTGEELGRQMGVWTEASGELGG